MQTEKGNFIARINDKIKQLYWLDMALTKFGCFIFGVILVILFPKLIEINIIWLIAVGILLIVRPLYRFFK